MPPVVAYAFHYVPADFSLNIALPADVFRVGHVHEVESSAARGA